MIELIYAGLLSYFVVLNFGYLSLSVVSAGHNRRRIRQALHTDYDVITNSGVTIPVSVIIPAFDEEQSIVACVDSALGSDHPEIEVIVVNDGSTDDTLRVATGEFALEPCEAFHPSPIPTKPVRGVYRSRTHGNLWLIDKENGSQADAYNAGVNLARYRYVVQIDADCMLDPQALTRTMRVINDDPGLIVGAAGQLRASNKRQPLVVKFQIIEYLCAFLTQRAAWSWLNCVPVVAGGYGVWRKDVVIELGGYATDVTHPDIELTQAVHEWFRRREIPYKIAFVPDAVVHTELPATWRDLARQRKRWQRVVIEVAWKYRRMTFDARYGSAGIVGMPYLILYEALGPIIELVAYLFVVVLAILGVLSVESLLLFLCASVGLTIAVRLAGILSDVTSFQQYKGSALGKLLALTLLEPLARPFLLPARTWAFVEFARGRRTWERVERVGAAEGQAAA